MAISMKHKSVTIDVNNQNAPNVVAIANVNDKAVRYLDVTLTASGEKLTFADCTVTATFATDGYLISDSVACTLNSTADVITVPLENFKSMSGFLAIEIKIANGETQVLNTPLALKVKVTPSLLDKSMISKDSVGTAAEICREVATARGGQNSLGARLDTADANLANKANKATTLAGYGITDAYTKEKTDKKLAQKLNSMPFDSEPKNNSPCYLTSGTVYNSLLTKADKSETYAKDETDDKLDEINASVTELKSDLSNYDDNLNGTLYTVTDSPAVSDVQIGRLSIGDGGLNTTDYRDAVVINNPIYALAGSIVYIDSPIHTFAVFEYDKKYSGYRGGTKDLQSGDVYKVKQDGYIRAYIATVDGTDASLGDVEHIKFNIRVGYEIEKTNNNIDILSETDEFIFGTVLGNTIVFETGGLNANDGAENTTKNRIRSNCFKAVKGSKIRLKSKGFFKFGIWRYSDINCTNFINYRGLEESDYIVESDEYIRIVIAPLASGTCILGDETNLLTNVNKINLSADLTEVVLNDWVSGYIPVGNYTLGQRVPMVKTWTASWMHTIIDCKPGDMFHVKGYGGNAGRLWSVIDENFILREVTDVKSKEQDVIIVVQHEGKLIVNVAVANNYALTKITESLSDKIKYISLKKENNDMIIPPTMPDIRHVVSSVPYNGSAPLTLEEVIAGYDELVSTYPNYVTKTELGKDTSNTYSIYRYDFTPTVPSVDGKIPVTSHTYAKDNYPVLIMDACIHGGELPCARAMLNLMKMISDAKDNSILGWLRNNIHFVVIPIVNPYGYANGGKRNNVNNVDINRNFEVYWEYGSDDATEQGGRYRGTSPLSEKETQYVNAILTEYANKAICYYNWHTHGVFTSYELMTCYSASATKDFDVFQKIGFDVIKSITNSGWANHNLPLDSGYIGIIQSGIVGGTSTYTGTSKGIPSACPELMYRYYDGGTGQVYNTDVNCMNVEYMLYSVGNACKEFLYK